MIKITLQEVKKCLPHRWPFLLINSCVTLTEKTATTSRSFGFFWWLACKLGHFRKFPIVPGVVSVELCAQLCALIIIAENKAHNGLPIFRATKATFIKPIQPFETIYAEAVFKKEKLGLMCFSCKVCNEKQQPFCEFEITGTSMTAQQFSELLNATMASSPKSEKQPDLNRQITEDEEDIIMQSTKG